VNAAASSQPTAGRTDAASSGQPVGAPPCAAATRPTLAATYGVAAERIYESELAATSTVRDQQQVETNAPLLTALAQGDPAKVHEAVVGLVYSHTHIVRLRVSSPSAALLADVGGPYIIAPVGGTLSYQGQTVGSYLLSVQDDLGYVGLEKRLIGLPVALHMSGKRVPIRGTVHSGARPLPNRGTVKLRGVRLQVYSFDAKAYPAGVLRITIFVPRTRPSKLSCAAVHATALGRIGQRIWNRFVADGSPVDGFVAFAAEHTGSMFFVRSGTTQVAGSAQPGPPAIPDSGPLEYDGRPYWAVSFVTGSLRISQLVPV
jgi:hypothetical protein